MGMEDLILNYTGFDDRFATNEQCLDYVRELRWADGYKCPRCSHNEAWQVSPYKYKCRNCGYQATVTAGTFFHKTHLPMLQWFQSIYYCSVRRDRATATELQDLLGIGSNRTAQSIINRLKPMLYCSSPDKIKWVTNKLTGSVEVDSYYIRFRGNDINLRIAVEIDDSKVGCIRIRPTSQSKNFEELYISENAVISYPKSKRLDARSYVKKVVEDFEKWCQGKEKYDFEKVLSAYCRMINRYKTPVTFDEILRNILSGDPPPRHDSSLI